MTFPAKTFRPFRKEIRLAHSPVAMVTRSSSYVSQGAHQVLLEAVAGGMAYTQFMSATEALEVGQALIDAGRHYQEQAAFSGEPVAEGTLQQSNTDLESSEHQSAGPVGGFDRRAAA